MIKYNLQILYFNKNIYCIIYVQNYCIKYVDFNKSKIIKIEIMKNYYNYYVMLRGWIIIKIIGKYFFLNISFIS